VLPFLGVVGDIGASWFLLIYIFNDAHVTRSVNDNAVLLGRLLCRANLICLLRAADVDHLCIFLLVLVSAIWTQFTSCVGLPCSYVPARTDIRPFLLHTESFKEIGYLRRLPSARASHLLSSSLWSQLLFTRTLYFPCPNPTTS
jgi:hypothetical protein